MKLSVLLKLSPLGYEEVKRETIKQRGLDYWESMVMKNAPIGCCIDYYTTENTAMWLEVDLKNNITILKEWEANQTV